MNVTITLGTGAYVRHGQEAHWQPPTSTVRVDGAPRIVVTGTQSELVLSTGTVNQGEEFSHTFEVPGEYVYFCTPHQTAGMVASLTVKE